MPALAPFTPAATVSRTVTSSTANVQLPAIGGDQVIIQSVPGGNIAFVKFGTDNTVTAATTDLPILPGAMYVFTIPYLSTYIAAIGSATTTLYITRGDGA